MPQLTANKKETTFAMGQLTDLPQVAEQLLPLLATTKNVTFSGQVGAGKTTFIKVLCEQLGCADVTSSPSYAIVNEYACTPIKGREKVYHIDLYRLNAIEEAFDIGIEEYLSDPTAWCFIEWPELVEPLLEEPLAEISIALDEHTNRTLTLRL